MSQPRLTVRALLRPHAKPLAIAAVAMALQGLTELFEPWPLKIIFDYVLGSKAMPAWLDAWLRDGHDRLTILNIAAVSVVIIAVVNAMESMSAAMYQSMCQTLTEPELRSETIGIGALAARHAAAAAIMSTGAPEGYVSPVIVGAELVPAKVTGLEPAKSLPIRATELS